MFNVRILTATSFICIGAFFVSTSLLWARKPRSDQDICASQETLWIADCLKLGHSLDYCGANGQRLYDACMLRKGHGFGETNPSGPPTNIAGGYPTPPPRPTGVRPPTTVGNNPGPGSTPTKTKPVHPISGPVTNKGPVSSPTPTPQTIYAKPKSSPSPSQHKGRHG